MLIFQKPFPYSKIIIIFLLILIAFEINNMLRFLFLVLSSFAILSFIFSISDLKFFSKYFFRHSNVLPFSLRFGCFLLFFLLLFLCFPPFFVLSLFFPSFFGFFLFFWFSLVILIPFAFNNLFCLACYLVSLINKSYYFASFSFLCPFKLSSLRPYSFWNFFFSLSPNLFFVKIHSFLISPYI